MPFTTIVSAGAASGALAEALAAATSARVVATGAESAYAGGPALRRVVAAESAELLVLAAHDREVSDPGALHGAPCAIAVAPPAGPEPLRLERIGVGVDTGSEGRVAVALARDLGCQTDARLELFAVVDDGVPAWISSLGASTGVSEALVQRRLPVALELLSELLEGLHDVEAGGKLLVGHPAHQLARATAHLDLLILGSRRSGPAGRLALGTTSERLLHDATVPLLIVPRGDEDRRAARHLPARTLHAMV